jgi:hypothetical protein
LRLAWMWSQKVAAVSANAANVYMPAPASTTVSKEAVK